MFGAVAVALVLAGAVGAASAAWPPNGYYRWSSTIAYKWGKGGSCSQDFMGCGCWHVYVVAKNGCRDGLFVTLNEYSHGAVVGNTIAELQSLPPRTAANLELDADRSGALTGRLAQIRCYSF